VLVSLRHVQGWAEVRACVAVEMALDLDGLADRYRKEMEDDLGEMTKTAFGRKARLGGEAALRHTATGTLENGRVVTRQALFTEKNGFLYTVITQHYETASEQVRAEVDAIVKSFRFLD
jgi:hypothetical protein